MGVVVVSYGMTGLARPTLPMWALIKNTELKGSTLGLRREFGDMVRFVTEAKVRPVVKRVGG